LKTDSFAVFNAPVLSPKSDEVHVELRLLNQIIGAGAGDVGRASAPPKVLICQKFGQNLKTFGHRRFEIF